MIETQERPITTDNMNLDGANYINGEFRESSTDVYANMNPSTETVLGSYPQSSAEEVTEAYTAARQAFPEWKTVSRLERAEYMYRVAKLIEERTELLATAISLETGKNYNESIAEVNEALHMAQ